jgi:hypothetical protein
MARIICAERTKDNLTGNVRYAHIMRTMINRSKCRDHLRICSEWPRRRFATAPVMRDLNTKKHGD